MQLNKSVAGLYWLHWWQVYEDIVPLILFPPSGPSCLRTHLVWRLSGTELLSEELADQWLPYRDPVPFPDLAGPRHTGHSQGSPWLQTVREFFFLRLLEHISAHLVKLGSVCQKNPKFEKCKVFCSIEKECDDGQGDAGGINGGWAFTDIVYKIFVASTVVPLF